MTIIITGVAGLVGSNLASFFLKRNVKVIGIDNLILGKRKNIKNLLLSNNFYFKKLDLSNYKSVKKFFNKIKKKKIKTIWHFASNSDIKRGVNSFDIDYKNTFLTTFNLIKICKEFNIVKFYFASTSAVYGNFENKKLKEETGPLLPLSSYGATKLASEALISAATENFLKRAYIFRFPNVVGSPLTHGVIYDFYNKLKKNSKRLNVLGNGNQQKIYMHVSDLIDSMIFVSKKSQDKINLINIGPSDKGIKVKKIAEMITTKFGNSTNIVFEKKIKGWPGDIPKFFYDTRKLHKLGYKKKLSSLEAVDRCISELND